MTDTQHRPLLNARLGRRSNIEQYQTITGGAGYVFRRNFRMLAEVIWDFEVDETRLTLGLTTAF